MFVGNACYSRGLPHDAVEPLFLGEVGDYEDASGLVGAEEGPERGYYGPWSVCPHLLLLARARVNAAQGEGRREHVCGYTVGVIVWASVDERVREAVNRGR